MFASNLVRDLMRIHKPSTVKDEQRMWQLASYLHTWRSRNFDEIFRWEIPKSSTKADQQKDAQKNNTNLLGFVFFDDFLRITTMLNHHEQPPWFGMSKSNFFQALPRRGATPKNCNHLFSGAAAWLLLYGFGWIQSMKHTRVWHLSSVVTSVSEGLLWWLS